VDASVTVIAEVVAPVLHSNVPPEAVVDNTELPQLLAAETTGVEGVEQLGPANSSAPMSGLLLFLVFPYISVVIPETGVPSALTKATAAGTVRTIAKLSVCVL
jgi:hypothetical protein